MYSVIDDNDLMEIKHRFGDEVEKTIREMLQAKYSDEIAFDTGARAFGVIGGDAIMGEIRKDMGLSNEVDC